MIPCMICGKDASTSWVYGFSPAPDSLKAGLCRAHDSPKNRELAIARWQEDREREIEIAEEVSLYKAAPNVKKLVVHYIGGGIATFSCIGFQAMTHDIKGGAGSLRIDELNGRQTFIPMAHVKKYTAYPMRTDEASLDLVRLPSSDAAAPQSSLPPATAPAPLPDPLKDKDEA